MSYRILVDNDAGQSLRTLSGHVVERIGRVLADLVAAASDEQPSGPFRLDLAGCVLSCAIDATTRTISVLSVEPRGLEAAAEASA